MTQVWRRFDAGDRRRGTSRVTWSFWRPVTSRGGAIMVVARAITRGRAAAVCSSKDHGHFRAKIIVHRTSIIVSVQVAHTHNTRIYTCNYFTPSAVTELVEYWSHVWKITGSNPWSSQTSDLSNGYLSLPSQVLGIMRIGQGLVGAVSG